MPPKQKVSMATVAKAAGVSNQTVSRALAGDATVKPQTRSRVLEATRQTGYQLPPGLSPSYWTQPVAPTDQPTGNAERAATASTSTARPSRTKTATRNTTATTTNASKQRQPSLGLLFHGRFPVAETIFGIHQQANQAGYLVVSLATELVGSDALVAASQQLLDQGIDGLIYAVPVSDQVVIEQAAAQVPVSVIGSPDYPVGDLAWVDQQAAARIATEYLLELGHQTVWHLAGPNHWPTSAERIAGWRAALEKAGHHAPPMLQGDWSVESGYRNGLVLSRLTDVKAIVAANGDMALGLMQGLAKSERRVPDDVSVIGLDDAPCAAFLAPPLTTVCQPLSQLGQEAVKQVINRIENPDLPRQSTALTPRLQVRESTAPPS